MPTITISLPKELKERLDRHKDINWPEVFRRAFEKKVKYLEEFEKFMQQRGEL